MMLLRCLSLWWTVTSKVQVLVLQSSSTLLYVWWSSLQKWTKQRFYILPVWLKRAKFQLKKWWRERYNYSSGSNSKPMLLTFLKFWQNISLGGKLAPKIKISTFTFMTIIYKAFCSSRNFSISAFVKSDTTENF